MSLFIDNMLFYGLLLFAVVSCISLAAQNVVAVLLLLCFLAKVTLEKKRLIPDDNLIKGIALFFAVATISAIFALNKQMSLDVWSHYLYRLSIFFVAAFSIKTRKQVQWILIALALSISIADSYAIWQWLNGAVRVDGFFRHPMMLAGCLMIIIPILGIQALDNRAQWYIFIPSLMLSLFTLVINQTRGAWIAMGITAIIGCGLLRRYRKQIIVYLTVMLVLLFFFFSLNSHLTARFQSIFDMEYQSNAERILMWDSAIQMMMHYPITGIGLGNFYEQYNATYISPLAKESGRAHAHNNVLHIFAETGILGGVAFMYMFYMIFKNYYSYIASIDTWKSSMAIMGMLGTTALFLQGLTEYNFGHSVVVRLFWFTLGVAFASFQMKEEH